MFNYTTIVSIPAYDNYHNGLIINIKLTAISRQNFSIHSVGSVAQALQRNFKRIVDIMASLKQPWYHLQAMHYRLECEHQYQVHDTKSSSMALSIALINLHRALHQKRPVLGLAGTGMLRIDGSFEQSHFEEKKYLAAQASLKNLTKFITPTDSKHIFVLEKLINQLS